jgi:glycosyltransferase involved in cell wall biosynthesis
VEQELSEKQYDLEIIIPCYNEEEFLSQAVNSVIRAREKSSLKIAILISDNCSKDKSLSIAQKFMNSSNDIRIIAHKKNIGARANWVNALKTINARYFMFLDAHDFISDEYFLEAERILVTNNFQNIILMPNEYMVFQDSKKPTSRYPFQYKFHKNPKIRFWQLLFYLGHATEIHSIFPSNKSDFNLISTSKAYSFDQLVMFIFCLKYNSRYLESAYFRRYKTVVSENFSYVNSYGESESRFERVSGESEEQVSDYFLIQEIIHSSSLNIPVLNRQLARFLLRGKYQSNILDYSCYRVGRKLFGLFDMYRGIKKL